MLREMNKASAGFTPPDLGLDEAPFTRIATGNWGCGAFGGFVELKAVLQWLAASQCRIPLKYFPYSESFGPRLHKFCASLVREQVTVGELWKGLLKMRSVLKTVLGKHAGTRRGDRERHAPDG
jgi:poly(ADP-ribose) glycohydrolase